MTAAELQEATDTVARAYSALSALTREHTSAYRTLADFAAFIGQNFEGELEAYVAERAPLFPDAYQPNVVEFAQHLMTKMKAMIDEMTLSFIELSRDKAIQDGELNALRKIQEIIDGVRRDPESGL